MDAIHNAFPSCVRLAAAIGCLLAGGCRTMDCAGPTGDHDCEPIVNRISPDQNCMPKELDKTVMPTYVIEPPDILSIQLLDAIPKPPYVLKTLDVVNIQVAGTLPEAPIAGVYPIAPGGHVNLGVPYGAVKVAGMSVEDAQTAIAEHLKKYLRDPSVSLSLAELAAAQQLVGEFLVAPDGTITLGSYGNVSVVGLTLADAKMVIEEYLGQFLENPKVSLSIFAYNSKVYYVVMQGAGLGDGIYRYPLTGNETVLDALTQVNGINEVSSKKIWIARPTRDPGQVTILPVDYYAITEHASTSSNFQIMPGDRVFVAEDKLVALDTQLAKIITPVERLMGFTLLGTATVTRLSGKVLKGGGQQFGNNASVNIGGGL